jgi:hypothetical protein
MGGNAEIVKNQEPGTLRYQFMKQLGDNPKVIVLERFVIMRHQWYCTLTGTPDTRTRMLSKLMESSQNSERLESN